MNKTDLKNYICSVPFNTMEIHEKNSFLCCPSWLPKSIPNKNNPTESWNSDEANDIRKSILDGSYKYCDKLQCPFLQQLNTFGEIGNTKVFNKRNNLDLELKTKIELFENEKIFSPSLINFCFDRSCNLKCPSCRLDMIVENTNGIKRVKSYINSIETEFGKDVKTLYITGTGDPFVSVGFRDFLRNFDSSKWPNLQSIHLHTNATRWNKKMWDSMSNIHKYVKTCEISIDAATKETYENKVRLGGNWDELIDNLKFISTIPTLKSVKTSFVVQQSNYKEMEEFYNLMYSIFANKVNVFFGKITNWGTFTEEDYLKHKVWDESHPLHSDFLKELNSFILKDKVWHNLQEFVKPIKNVI